MAGSKPGHDGLRNAFSRFATSLFIVMAALEAAIQPLHHKAALWKDWMAGSKPGHDGLRTAFSR